MQYLPDGVQMKRADEDTINNHNIAGSHLMELAGCAAVDVILSKKCDLTSVLILCGNGGNAGDGFVIARLLSQKGHKVTVLFFNDKKRLGKDARLHFENLLNTQVNLVKEVPKEGYTIIIDALFGAGLNRTIEGKYEKIINQVNQMTGCKVAIDLPSGISSQSGKVLGTAFYADFTIAIQNMKFGLLLGDGRSHAGEIIVKDIGIREEVFFKDLSVVTAWEQTDYHKQKPLRLMESHKGTYGKLLIIAGSKGMSGAAYLNALSAYRVGAGLVRIYTCEENRAILQVQLPECIISTYKSFDKESLKKELAFADTVLIGSGLGLSKTAEEIFQFVLQTVSVPCVIDGDGLTLLAKMEQKGELLQRGTFICTPHMKEMTRLLNNRSIDEIKTYRREVLRHFCNENGVTCVLKDARTLVAGIEKHMVLNMKGNSGMAKAGSGDVLAGIITGLLGQGLSLFSAAVLGVYVHGCAGDMARDKLGEYGILAHDISDYIGTVMDKL